MERKDSFYKMREKMKTKKDVQLELLKELDDICSKKGLTYILTGYNGLNAYLNHTIKKGPISVITAMTEGDLNRFIKIIEKKHKDRYVEGSFNNPNHEEDYVFFGNRNTTDFNMIKPDTKLYHGINIQIYPITLTESELNVPTQKDKLLMKTHSLINNESDEKLVLNKWKNIQNYKLVDIIDKTYEADIFKEIKRIDVDGIKLCIPDESDEYFKIMYGNNFKNRKIREKTQPNHIIIDTDYGYDEIMEEIGDLVVESRRINEEIQTERQKELKDYEDITNIWNLVEMTSKQLELREYFKENDEILNYDLNDEEEFKNIYKDLRKAINTLKKYAKHGMTFSINPEIDQLIEKVLIKKGEDNLVLKIKELSNKEYFIE